MSEAPTKRERVLSVFHRALEEWLCGENEQPMSQWLAREVDSQGVLIRLAISDWHQCLRDLLAAKRTRNAWPASWREPVTRLIRASSRFSRPDGTPATDFEQLTRRATGSSIFRDWAKAGGVIADGPGTGGRPTAEKCGHSSQNHDAWGGSHRVLAALGTNGLATSDFLIVDHRDAGGACRFELFGAGCSWLGPAWAIDGEPVATSPPSPRSWISDSDADLAEWSYRAAESRITHSAVLLRGTNSALLSVLIETGSALTSNLRARVSLAPEVGARPVPDRRDFLLTGPKKRGSLQVLPIGLPCRQYATDRGDFQAQNSTLILKHAPTGRRSWLPLLVSWDPRRNRKDVHWRVLTVSERSRNIAPDRAFAARVSWGRDESYVVYRSLGPPAQRAFLGHHTAARFLIGALHERGERRADSDGVVGRGQ